MRKTGSKMVAERDVCHGEGHRRPLCKGSHEITTARGTGTEGSHVVRQQLLCLSSKAQQGIYCLSWPHVSHGLRPVAITHKPKN